METQKSHISPELKKRILEIGENDPVFINEFVSIFIRNTTKCLQQLRENSHKKNLFALQQLGHKLKSNFTLLDQTEAKHICGEIEIGNNLNEIDTLIHKLEVIIPNINKQLAHFLS